MLQGWIEMDAEWKRLLRQHLDIQPNAKGFLDRSVSFEPISGILMRKAKKS
jgi:hypothetical protein